VSEAVLIDWLDGNGPTMWAPDPSHLSNASVHVVTVGYPDDDRAHVHHHIFSTAEKAQAYADAQVLPCVISTYVIDAPERYTEAAQ
jgi:hypothetical protein